MGKKMRTAIIILSVCGAVVLFGTLGFVMITDIFLSDLAAKLIITTALGCFEAALVLWIIHRCKNRHLPWVAIGIAIGLLITMVQSFLS